MRTAPLTLLVWAILVAPQCSGQDLLNKLQGQWRSWSDSVSIISVEGQTWTFSNNERTSSFEVRTREWVVDHADERRQIIHDEAILTSQYDTTVVRIDCVCGDTLYLSNGPFPKGAVYRRIK